MRSRVARIARLGGLLLFGCRTATPKPIAALTGATLLRPNQYDGDGKPDLLVTFAEGSPEVQYLGDGKGGFTKAP